MTEKVESAGGLRRIDGRHNAQVKDLRRAFDSGELGEGGCAPSKECASLKRRSEAGCAFKEYFSALPRKIVRISCFPNFLRTSKRCCCPTSFFKPPCPANLLRASQPWCAAASSRSTKFWPTRRPVRLLAVAGLQDPGNLGTILRSAEAFGASGVLLGEGTVSAFNTKVVRASAGSVFRLPMAKTKLMPVCRALRKRPAVDRDILPRRHPVAAGKAFRPLAIFIGSEGAGLPQELLAKMDSTVAIPHSTHVESLNAGVAASIILYEASRQRAPH